MPLVNTRESGAKEKIMKYLLTNKKATQIYALRLLQNYLMYR